MDSAREWVVQDFSQGYKSLLLRECETQEPGPGEVRLRIEAFALNWGDMDLMDGRYTFVFDQLPARVGMEAVGIVDMIGSGVEGVQVGDRCSTLPHYYYDKGASADSIIIDQRYITKAPESLSAIESASIWMQYLTAYYPLVEVSNLGLGSNVLVTGATSTAGGAALEIGRICGANMVGTTRYERNSDYLKSKGADHVCVSSDSDFLEQLKSSTGDKGFDAVFDSVGGTVMKQYSQHLAIDTHIYFYGFLEGEFPELPFIELLNANGVFHPYSMFNYIENPVTCAKGKDFVYEQIASGKLKPAIDKVYPMEGYIDAWDYMRTSRQSHGKIVIETGQ